jgi:group I intron endonuclease
VGVGGGGGVGGWVARDRKLLWFYTQTLILKKQLLLRKIGIKPEFIYESTNKNNKIYVGSAINLIKRFYMYCSIKHLAGAKSSLICKALRKYGHSLFSFGVLEYCDKKDIYIREQYYIDTLNPEYNISRVAGSPLGVIRSKETKAKIAAARSGCMHSVETKTKISVGVFGRKHTEQALIKMREAKKDNKHPLFGKTHTEETKTKMSVASPSSGFSPSPVSLIIHHKREAKRGGGEGKYEGCIEYKNIYIF